MSGSGRASKISLFELDLTYWLHQHHIEGGMFTVCLDRDELHKYDWFGWNLIAAYANITMKVGCSQCVWIGMGFKKKKTRFGWNRIIDYTNTTMKVGCLQHVWIGTGFKNTFDLIGVGLLTTPKSRWRWGARNVSGSGRVPKISLFELELNYWLHQHHIEGGMFTACLDRDGFHK